jgi:NDP-sugar pyrophosphorylase family protein
MQGQWLPIPTPDELVELQAKAKAYDKGSEQWQIWDPCHSKLEMIGRTESEAITAFRHSIVSNNPPEPWSQYLAAGYTCSKVRVCKEVES